jgi:hypothetical protein
MINGRKPTPVHLRLITGRHRNTRHGSEEAARRAVQRASKAFGKLAMPRHFEGHAREAWQAYIVPAGWLDKSREPCAILLCELWAEYRAAPRAFKKHKSLTAYMGLLGLTDERNRGPNIEEDEPDEHFD